MTAVIARTLDPLKGFARWALNSMGQQMAMIMVNIVPVFRNVRDPSRALASWTSSSRMPRPLPTQCKDISLMEMWPLE